MDPARANAAARLPDRIAFLGFGLIGGSVAAALRAAGYRGTLTAWTPEGRGPREGVSRGIIDTQASTLDAAIDRAGLMVLAGPPLAILDVLRRLIGLGRDPEASPEESWLPDHPTITDVGSTKAAIVSRAGGYGLPFVGGHPMAGRESSGVPNATADLFIGRPWVIAAESTARPIDLERVEALAVACGARPVRMEPAEHDAAVAAISHLPLAVSAALVESVINPIDGTRVWPAAKGLAASGWRDMTRLARGDPEMGAGILATNGREVAGRLRSLRASLDAWIETLDPAIGGGDPKEIEKLLAGIRRDLEADQP